jgi:two-component system chemotaxis response regulator CheY
MARGNKPDLVVTDIMMPEMDGLRLIQEIRNDPSLAETPIIVMTSREEMKELISMAEVQGFIPKPLNRQTMLEAIKKVLADLETAGAVKETPSDKKGNKKKPAGGVVPLYEKIEEILGDRGRAAFTLMELMLVVIILGIIAGFALPNMDKLYRKSQQRDITNYLRLIHGASEIYKAGNGTYWNPGDTAAHTLSEINNALRLSIPANARYTYQYSTADAGVSYLMRVDITGLASYMRVSPTPLSTTSAPPNPCCQVMAANECFVPQC